MFHIQPPNLLTSVSSLNGEVTKEMLGPIIFLGGSIEMNTASHWQSHVITRLGDRKVTFLNPRRDDWDNSIVQSCEDDAFREQVNWELSGLMNSDLVVFYLDPDTKSPITLMEIGLIAGKGIRSIICCPDGFWRKGNVEIMSDRFDIPLIGNLNRLTSFLDTFIEHFNKSK